jgi:hypothetical protein
MRTTLNIDDDVAQQLAELSRSDGRSISRVANDLMRAGLRTARSAEPLPPYAPAVFDTGEVLMDVTDVSAALARLDELD